MSYAAVQSPNVLRNALASAGIGKELGAFGIARARIELDSVAQMITAPLEVGKKVKLSRFYDDGNAVLGLYYEVKSGVTPDGKINILLNNGNVACLEFESTLTPEQLGARGVGDEHEIIQAAIDAFPNNLVGGGKVVLNAYTAYTHSVGFIIPPNITVDCATALTTYTGTGKAWELGNSDTVLSYDCKLLNVVIVLESKLSCAVYLRGTAGAQVTGYIEGGHRPYSNTRENIAVWIDGRNVSSFFNRISVRANHIHEGFRIKTTGTVQSTQHFFDNCSILGDQELDDTSIGYNFGPADNGNVQEGQGTVINGGNVEKCNTGVYIGPKAGRVTITGLRTEIVIGGTAWKFKIESGAEPLTLIGINGLGTTYMETASGITGWANNSGNTLIGGDAGEMRISGFDAQYNGQSFLGIGTQSPRMFINGDADFNFLSDSDATGTGRAIFQIGKGSAGHGGGIAYHGNSHPTYGGQAHIFGSINKGVRVTNGLYGATHAEIRNTGIANTTSLWLWDASAGSLKQVQLANSSGGYRVLRVAG